MSHPSLDDDEKELDPAAARIVANVRRLMVISGLTTLLAVFAVLGVIGYRLFRAEGSAPPAEYSAVLPKGARVVSMAVAGDRIVVAVEIAGTLEIHTFDAVTLKPAGRLTFAPEP
jgi:hypothetical protein